MGSKEKTSSEKSAYSKVVSGITTFSFVFLGFGILRLISSSSAGMSPDSAATMSLLASLGVAVAAYFVYKLLSKKISKYESRKAKVVIGILVAIFTFVSLMVYGAANVESQMDMRDRYNNNYQQVPNNY